MPGQQRFHDRRDAGRALAQSLSRYQERDDVLVLALPRGGVPVAFEIARSLKAPLDVFVVRKLGVPWHPELAMGAIASDGIEVLNGDVITAYGIPPAVIRQIADREGEEVRRRVAQYRGDRRAPEIAGHTIILVDDGLATGSTMRAAIAAVRQQKPRAVVVAVPVAAVETCYELKSEVDDIICLQTPLNFSAVGAWYEDFTQTSDEEVRRLLSEPTAPHAVH